MMCRMYDPVSGREVSQRLRQPFTSAPYQEPPTDDDGYVSFTGDVSVLDVSDPRSSPAMNIDPDDLDIDIGGLGKGDCPAEEQS